MTDLFPVTLPAQIACVEREIRMRQSVYPRWLAAKKMSEAKAEAEIAAMQAVLASMQRFENLTKMRPLEEWHEDFGDVLWWKLPIEEAPFVGSPLDSSFPGDYHTHWSPIPQVET